MGERAPGARQGVERQGVEQSEGWVGLGSEEAAGACCRQGAHEWAFRRLGHL